MENKLRTSLNVDSFVSSKISKLSQDYDLTKANIIKDLIKNVIKNFKAEKITESLTEYQNHHPNSWVKLDYSLSSKENELFNSARLLYKISISKMLFMGFLLFWKELLYYYKERLKGIKIQFHSYEMFKHKYLILVEYFQKRMCLIQKE